ncbi:CPBP family intramembrane metalloprotease [Romboutsia weinsteinii]|uniref:CPBP family intramembrane metalloprotease n=1 Tax=Romboutsia weinsteinii TaxID=2020949 RepID=A0A371J2P9_9FIRM|nr:ABC transporter permease subunit/CPBP intramembrane protease [Romboutsia weinsteinii]RDY26938.1 CPBP family intramembrane metalloprotease [Romboutsia weinsteinii]
MRTKIVKYILKKELLDILRDKKTIFMMIILPLILYPVLLIGMTQVMSMSMNSMNQQELTVGISKELDGDLSKVVDELNNENSHNDGELNFVSVEDYEKSLEESRIDAYLSVDDNKNYKIYINSSQNNSNTALSKIEKALDKYKELKVEEKLSEEGLDVKSTLEPISYESVDLAKNEELAGSFLGQLLPFILVMGVLLGAIYPAIDVMAGEKERGTLETLFTLPISNLELVMGKYLAVSFSAIVTAVLNVFSILLTMVFLVTSSGLSGELGIDSFKFKSLVLPIIITIVCIGLFAMVVSAVVMCVCSLAKNFKDAQNYITPVMLLVMIPSYVSMIPTIELDTFTATIPVVNISLLIKSVLSFKSDLSLIALVLVSNLAFVFLSVLLLSKMFNSEDILFGNNKSFSFLEKRSNIKKGTIPGISDGVVLYGVGLLLFIYIGSLVQMKFGMTGLGITQIMIIGLPLIFAHYIKTDFKKTFSLNIPEISHLISGVILWIGAYILVMLTTQIMLYIFPQNMEALEGLSKALFGEDNFLVNLFVVAIMPAICEEIFFRGFLFTSFRGKKSVKGAILGSAILFAFMHIEFIKILPITILGSALAYSVYKSGSIYVSMLIHFLNNGLAVVVSHYPNGKLAALYSLLEVDFGNPNWIKIIGLIVISVLLIGISALIFNGSKKKGKVEA